MIMSSLDNHGSAIISTVCNTVLLLTSSFLSETIFRADENNQHSHPVIRSLTNVVRKSPNLIHPFLLLCDPTLPNTSTILDKDRSSEPVPIWFSDRFELVALFFSILLMTKREFLSKCSVFADKLGQFVPYPILWILSPVWRFGKYAFFTLPMTCCSWTLNLLLSPFRCTWRIGVLIFFILLRIVVWLWRNTFGSSKKGYSRLSGSDDGMRYTSETRLDMAYEKAADSVHENGAPGDVPKKASFGTQMQVLLDSVKNEPERAVQPGKDETEKEMRRDLEEFRNSLQPSEEDFRRQKELDEIEKKAKEEYEEAKRKLEEIKRKQDSESEEEGAEQRELDEEFRRKLEEQQSKLEAELRELRERREEIARETAAELERMRMESQQRIQVFLECIQLKMRFEDKEQEWKDMLEGLRKPLVRVCIAYSDLRTEMENATKPDLEQWEKEEFQRSCKSFASKLYTAQDHLCRAFDQLRRLSEDYDDRIFIKIILKSLSAVAIQCDNTGRKLVEVAKTPTTALLSELDKQISGLSPHSIPTTASLRRDSPTARSEDYANIEEPPYPTWFSFFEQK